MCVCVCVFVTADRMEMIASSVNILSVHIAHCFSIHTHTHTHTLSFFLISTLSFPSLAMLFAFRVEDWVTSSTIQNLLVTQTAPKSPWNFKKNKNAARNMEQMVQMPFEWQSKHKSWNRCYLISNNTDMFYH